MTAIDDKYASLGGAGGFLGSPTTPEFPCPDLVGTFRHFQFGSIYWSPSTGAHEVHGAILDLWSSLGWELSPLGYPTSDEHDGPMTIAKVSDFQKGWIYWDNGRGAYEIFPRKVAPDPAPAVGGKWQIAAFDSEVVTMHAALLSGGRLLSLGYLEPMDHANPGPIPADHGESSVVDLTTGATSTPHYMGPFHMLPNIFCSGHAWLADGRWLIAGGDREVQERVRALHLYEPEANGPGHWRHVGMTAQGRWYVSCATLPDGRVVLVGGEKRTQEFNANLAFEVFDPYMEAVGTEIPQPSMLGVNNFISYPFLYVLPDHRLLVQGGTQTTMYDLPSLDFDGTVLQAIDRPDRQVRTYGFEGTSVLLPLRPDSNPPYKAKIMVIGGGGVENKIRTPCTETCEILDTSVSPLAWKAAASMHHARVMPDSVLLPDGKVLVMSGSSRGHADNGANPVWEAEMYDPATNTWTDVASTSVPRLYHSTALLMPDGRVMTAGSDSIWNPEPFHHPERRIELYSPPYLFAGARPVITDAPATIRPGGAPVVVHTPDAGTVDDVALMRVGSSTHSFNSDQRHVALQIVSAVGNTLTLAPPPDGYVAPPGPYLLFILRDGIPSVAEYVMVDIDGVHDRRAPVLGASRSLEHLDVFVTGRDGKVRTAAWEPSFGAPWHGWWEVAANKTFPSGAPVHAVSRSQDKLDIFATDGTGAVVTANWEPAFPDGWHGWTPVAGGQAPPGAPVTVASRQADRLDVFVVAADGKVMTSGWQPGSTWTPWKAIGTRVFPPGTTIGVVSRNAGFLDIFGVDVNGEVVTAAWEPAFGAGNWQGWWPVSAGHAKPGAPVHAVSRGLNKLDIFLTGDNGSVMTTSWAPSTGGWKPWAAIQAAHRFVPGAPVRAVSRSADHLDVFAVDVDGVVVTAAWEPSFPTGWLGWWAVNGARSAPGAPVSALTRGPDMLDVVYVEATDGRVATTGWGPGRGPAWTAWAPIG